MTIEQFLADRKEPPYRIRQFRNAYYRTLTASFAELTVWPKTLRDEAGTAVPFDPIREIQNVVSADGNTLKTVFARIDHPYQQFEAVLMRHRDHRNTVCVSCMVGCPMGCQFCATGTMGFVANLRGEEIAAQVISFARKLNVTGEHVTNIVFMGMGEPMVNLSGTTQAIEILTDPEKFGTSGRNITVSTSGVIAPLRKFIRDGFDGRLTVSLHAPNQKLRERIMPVAVTNPLPELMETLEEYVTLTGRRVSYEYILIHGLNDEPGHAHELGTLLRGRLAHVNLIPCNPVAGKPYRPPDRNDVVRFSEQLDRRRIPNTIRVTMGVDIGAACGQLVTDTRHHTDAMARHRDAE